MKRVAWLAVLLLAIAGGCAGGGAIPQIRTEPAAARRANVATATMIFTLPGPARGRRPSFISPNTRSIAVVVQPVTETSPWPAPLPTQVLAVTTPSPCVLTSKGYVCTFKFNIVPGKDQLSFVSYSQFKAAGTPLATYDSGIVSFDPKSPPFKFVLEGIPHDVALQVPNPQTQIANDTQILPIGAPTAFPLGIVVRDASGAQILSSKFADPISISVTGSKKMGVTLHVNPHCAKEPGPLSGATVTVPCFSDLTHVTVNYDGSVARNGSGQVLELAAIVASPEPASNTPPPASVQFASGVQTISPGSVGQLFATSLALAPDGKIFFATGGIGGNVIGTFDPIDPKGTLETAPLNVSANAAFVDSRGNFWVASQGEMSCFGSVTASPVNVSIPGTNVAALAQAGTDVWWQGLENTSLLVTYVGYVTPGSACGGLPSTSSVVAQMGSGKFNPIGLAANGTTGVWGIANIGNVPFDGEVFSATHSSTGIISSSYDFGSNWGVSGTASDNSGNLFVTLLTNNGPAANKVVEFPGGSFASPSPVFTAPPSSNLYAVRTYGSGAHEELTAIDGGYFPHAGMDVVKLGAPGSVQFVPVAASECFGLTYDANGSPWISCRNPAGQPAAFTTAYTSVWGITPSNFSIVYFSGYGGFPAPSAIGIVEKPGSDSSPFTVVGNTNPSVLATASPWPGGYSHDIPVTINSAGVTKVTIKDKNGFKQQLKISVQEVSAARRP